MDNLKSNFTEKSQVLFNRNSKDCIIINKSVMKRFLFNLSTKFFQTGFPKSWKLAQSMFLLLVLSGLTTLAQPALPEVTVRFANPVYICPPTNNYCVDVEMKANIEQQWVYGANIRFFYDDAELEFLGMSDFQTGYASVDEPQILTGPAGSGDAFGFAGPLEWFNGTLQLVSADNPVYLSTTGWTKMFKICFNVDNPASLKLENFCPSIVWDLKEPLDDVPPPETGDGFLPGDDGVVVTVFIPSTQESAPTFEIVEQFNWAYDQTGQTYGFNVPIICITTICGYIIPLSNWSLYLAIGLMLIVSLFIYRRRISG
jgi:hypothetical protein